MSHSSLGSVGRINRSDSHNIQGLDSQRMGGDEGNVCMKPMHWLTFPKSRMAKGCACIQNCTFQLGSICHNKVMSAVVNVDGGFNKFTGCAIRYDFNVLSIQLTSPIICANALARFTLLKDTYS